MIEAAKYEVRKYLKRSRRKALPEGADYWDFECKFGTYEEDAEKVHLAEIDKLINEAEKNNVEVFYVEVIPVPGVRKKKSCVTMKVFFEKDTRREEKSLPEKK